MFRFAPGCRSACNHVHIYGNGEIAWSWEIKLTKNPATAQKLCGGKNSRNFFTAVTVKKLSFAGKTFALDSPRDHVSIADNKLCMIREAKALPGGKAAFAGEIHSLLEQLGSPEHHLPINSFFSTGNIRDEQDLRKFLEKYQAQILIPVELHSIHEAYQHTTHNECRELIALDQKLAAEPKLKNFASASQHVGRAHLEHLRPLRDHRLVQRYLHAIDAGEASGWHTLVYGVGLAVYSLPLRQGLNAFANQTLVGFCTAVGRARYFDEAACREVADYLVDLNQTAIAKFFAARPTII